MQDKLSVNRTLVIGAGHIGQQHIRALKRVPGIEIAVCDRSEALSGIASDRYSISIFGANVETLIAEFKPQVAHICTPVSSHFPLAKQMLERGIHVIVEKPVTESIDQWSTLRELAERNRCWLIEDHNYLFNPPVQWIRRMVTCGEFGRVVHVDAVFALNILGRTSAFGDPHVPHPSLKMPGGAISDFLTHLSYLPVHFIGSAEKVRAAWRNQSNSDVVPYDEMRALVVGKNGTANLSFSAHSQPDVFRLIVYGTQMSASVNLFENTFQVEKRYGGSGPLTALKNSLSASASNFRGGFRSLFRKLASQPGGYAGLYSLIGEFYGCLRSGEECPVSLDQVEDTQMLVHGLLNRENWI